MNITIGINIKNLRDKKRITQKQLATYLGVTEQAVSRWESGGGYPDIGLLPSIASFFSVTTDELLGINSDAREHRLAEIRRKIDELGETGDNNEETLRESRIWAAEFPGEEDIQAQLADEICRLTMWEEKPDLKLLKEAEIIYRTLIDTTKKPDFRNDCIESLAVLYAVGFKDILRAEEACNALTSMKFCRESVKSTVFCLSSRETGDKEQLVHSQDYMERLCSAFCGEIAGYIINDLPNEPEHWDEKIGCFEKLIEIYKFFFGDNLLFYHADVAYLYRVIATYKVAQGKHDETVEVLEKMLYHVLEADKAKPGDKYTSLFTDKLVYPEPSEEFNDFIVHNRAFYFRDRMNQSRYDPIREREDFKAICQKLEASMK